MLNWNFCAGYRNYSLNELRCGLYALRLDMALIISWYAGKPTTGVGSREFAQRAGTSTNRAGLSSVASCLLTTLYQSRT